MKYVVINPVGMSITQLISKSNR